MKALYMTLLIPWLLWNTGCEGQNITAPETISGQSQNTLHQGAQWTPTAAQYSFETIAVNEAISDLGRITQTGQATHIRQQIITGSLMGDLVGTFENVFYVDLTRPANPSLLEVSTHRGEIHLVITELFGQAVDGGWKGRVHALIQLAPDGTSFKEYHGIMRAQGTGALEGLTLTGEFTSFITTTGLLAFQIQGRILDPRGMLR